MTRVAYEGMPVTAEGSATQQCVVETLHVKERDKVCGEEGSGPAAMNENKGYWLFVVVMFDSL